MMLVKYTTFSGLISYNNWYAK